jgi:tRNA (guanine37-N1)-methyltransferase
MTPAGNPFEITVLTLFPAWFQRPFADSILGRAQEKGLVRLDVRDLREWGVGRHRTVDDTPYGGGGGMVLKPEPVCAALDALAGAPGSPDRRLVVYTSPCGEVWKQALAQRMADIRQSMVILCGHYEGLDQRVIDSRVDLEISLGDFVMTGGEPAALAMVDSILRLLPGVLGCDTGAANDSHATGLLEAPHYTRPEVFEGRRVPEVLLSGHHAAIAAWRESAALRLTSAKRPDLLPRPDNESLDG